MLSGWLQAANFYFDVNGTNDGSGILDGGSYNVVVGTGATANWNTSSAGINAPVVFTDRNSMIFSAGTDAAGLSYTISGSLSQANLVSVEEGNITMSAYLQAYSTPTIRTAPETSLNITATWDFYSKVLPFDVQGNSTITLSSLSTTSGRSGGIKKTGTGLLTVNGASSARGITVNVLDGEMRILNGNGLFTSGYSAAVSITNTGTLELATNITMANNPITLSGNGYNNLGALRSYAGTNTYRNLITLASAGQVSAASGAGLVLTNTAGASVISGACDLTLGGGGNIVVAAPIDSITSLFVDSGTSVTFVNGSALYGAPAMNIGPGATLDLWVLGDLTLAGSQIFGGSGTFKGSVVSSSGSLIRPGGNLTTGTLTIATNLSLAGGETFQFDFAASTNSDRVVVLGDLTPGSGVPTTINLTTLPVGGLPLTNYTLFEVYGNLNGTASSFTVTAPSAQTFRIVYDTASTPKRVLMNVSGNYGPANLVWQGGQNGNAWDVTGTTSNWLNSANSAPFYTGDNVSFTDAGAFNQPVITAFVSPGSVTVNNNSPYDYTFSGTGGIMGAGGLTKLGSGTLTLGISNNYAGGTLVGGGSLVLADGGSLTGPLTNNAQVVFNRSDSISLSNPITGTGNLADVGGGSVTLTGPVVLGGTLADSASGSLTLSGSLAVGAGVTNSGPGTLTLGPVSISGGGGLVNSGGGTIVLSAASSYTGGTVNSSGTIQVGNGAAATLGSGPIANDGSLVLNSSQDFALAEVISGAGSLTKNGGNTVLLPTANLYDGDTSINNGLLIVSNAAALGSTNGITTIGGGSSVAALEWPGGLTLMPEAITLSGRQGSASYAPHIINLGGVNTIPGPITGATGGGMYNVESAGGMLVMGGDFSSSATTATRYLNLQGAGAGNWTGTIFNGGTTVAVTKYDSGLWTLSGTNTYTGPTVINGGTLALGSNGSNANTATITVNAGTLFDVSAGTFTLNSSQSLLGNGAISGTVTTSPGSQILPGGSGTVGTLTFSNNLVLSGGETLQFDFPGLGSNDLMVVQGDLTPAVGQQTTINLATLPASVIIPAGDYVLCQVFGNLNGTAASFAVTGPVGRQTFGVVYDTASSPKRVLLRVSGAAASLVWQGGLNANLWDVNATANWRNGAAGDVFFNGDNVLFTDAGAANAPYISGAVNPGSVLFTNTVSHDYTLSGSDPITGAGTLTKAGSGMLTLYSPNSYTGGTLLKGGTLSLAIVNALGTSGTIDFAGNATLQWNGITTDLSSRLKIEDGVTATVDTMYNAVTFASTLQLGSLKSGGLTKVGASQLTIGAGGGGNQSFTGPLTINEGSVKMSYSRTLAANINLALASGAYLYPDGSSLAFDQVTGSGTIGLTYTTSGTDTLTVGGANGSSQFDGSIVDSTGSRKMALTKSGTGTFTLTGASTYTGATLVNNGTLTVNGSLGNTAVTVATNATLAGTGVCGGAVTVQSGATLAPGDKGIGTLTVSGNLTVAGNLAVELDKSLAPALSNDFVSVTGILTNTGTGTVFVSNRGPALVAGDKFTLFSQPLPKGNNLSIVGPAGVTFANNLAADGSIAVLSVVSVAANPTNLTFRASAGSLQLSWPGDHLGWYAQSNSVSVANSNFWFDVPNSQLATNLQITVEPGKPNVFYRLRHP